MTVESVIEEINYVNKPQESVQTSNECYTPN